MEKPYKGRAIVEDKITGLRIIIPSRKNWFVILFVGAWLGGWLMGEISALGILITALGRSPAGFLFSSG